MSKSTKSAYRPILVLFISLFDIVIDTDKAADYDSEKSKKQARSQQAVSCPSTFLCSVSSGRLLETTHHGHEIVGIHIRRGLTDEPLTLFDRLSQS